MRPLAVLTFLAACTPTTPEPLSDCRARDPIDVLGVGATGTTLAVLYGHASGCAEHRYSLCWPDRAVDLSSPAEVTLVMWHDDGGENCEAYEEGTYTTDVQPILDEVGGPVRITVGGSSVVVGDEG